LPSALGLVGSGQFLRALPVHGRGIGMEGRPLIASLSRRFFPYCIPHNWPRRSDRLRIGNIDGQAGRLVVDATVPVRGGAKLMVQKRNRWLYFFTTSALIRYRVETFE